MTQKLSALKYIKNNKRRVAVLIVSLGLCFVMTYITKFLLSATEETMRPLLLEWTKKIQYIELAGSSLGIDVNTLSGEELSEEYDKKNNELAEKLSEYDGIGKVYYCPSLFCKIKGTAGQVYHTIPLVEKEEIPVIMQHFEASLSYGRFPENPGEIVIDETSLKNNGYVLNGYYDEDNYKQNLKIVGVLDCENYLGCGIPLENMNETGLIVLSSGIDDISKILYEEGIEVRENYDTVWDYQWGKKTLEKDLKETIDDATKYVYAGVIVLLTIALIVVYTTYLRDRHNEWCLYCSIGYSRKEIYFAIIRELLFTFVTALLIGGALIAVSVVLLNYIMLEPNGLKCKYFQPHTLGEIFCTYVLLMGVLQIPIRYALYKIRTVDAMDDELY